jgi:D-cysteine desulfhydrase
MARIPLAHLPTPLWHNQALDELVGTEVWIKRDDMTSGAAAGNKIRKLEYLLGEAVDRRATTVITCGGVQSNHARATAIAARELGMRTVLFLRTADAQPPAVAVGNVLLDTMVGAELRFITPDQYRQRDALMGEAARTLEGQGERAYVIPEGGSNGLGALGYVDAMQETRAQMERAAAGAPSTFDAVAVACGSGGTAAGCVVGARAFAVAPHVHAFAVCENAASFKAVIDGIVSGSLRLRAQPGPLSELFIHDDWKGPAYGVLDEEQRQFIVKVALSSGLILDPVYTGKALFGLSRLAPKPKRVLFIHTGGLPGLLAEADTIVGGGTPIQSALAGETDGLLDRMLARRG